MTDRATPFNRRLGALSWVVVLGSVSLVAGCGKSDSGAASTGGNTGLGGGNTGLSGGGSEDAAGAGSTVTATGCPTGSFNLLFSPVYSAYDGGAHDYKVPIYAPGVADPTTLTWSASDDSMVKIESDPNTGGVMVTTQKSGKVSIIATNSNGGCGTTLLTITDATADDWTAGSMRYNSGTTINRVGGPMRGAAGGSAADAGVDAQCTSCHGSTAAGAYKTVEHTPYQTGGFSDDDLINIIEHGMVPTTGSCAPAPGQTGPAAACFDPSVVSYAQWQTFHKWDAGDSEKGLVVYLRELVPVLTQTGMQNLGGGMFGTGGRPGGMGGARNGGNGGNGGRGNVGGAANGGTGNAGAPAAGADGVGGTPAGGTSSGGTSSGGTSSGGTGGDTASGA